MIKDNTIFIKIKKDGVNRVSNQIFLEDLDRLEIDKLSALKNFILSYNFSIDAVRWNITENDEILGVSFPQYIKDESNQVIDLAAAVGKLMYLWSINQNSRTKIIYRKTQLKYSVKNFNIPIVFDKVIEIANSFAEFLDKNRIVISSTLQKYECLNVAQDEIDRSIDHLKNLDKNKEYFVRYINSVVSFLPLNQPLYSLVCFGLVPSLMSKATTVRPPTLLHNTFQDLESLIPFRTYFRQFTVSYDSKENFVLKNKSHADFVIFTGNPDNAKRVRKMFGNSVVFMLNGAGHNPVVVAENADLNDAVRDVVKVCTQNQGQDCAAPNSILVHNNVKDTFCKMLYASLNDIQDRVGHYSKDSNIVGPNSDPDHVLRVSKIFATNRKFCSLGGEVNPIVGMIKPTVFVKPLEIEGGNYDEFYAPIFMVQPYQNDPSLEEYFGSARYKKNAMYVTLYGESPYVDSLIERGLHTSDNILRNIDLHRFERGFLPYGGLGPDASCIWVKGSRIPGATLPQRDIYVNLVKPLLENDLGIRR